MNFDGFENIFIEFLGINYTSFQGMPMDFSDYIECRQILLDLQWFQETSKNFRRCKQFSRISKYSNDWAAFPQFQYIPGKFNRFPKLFGGAF